MIPRRARRDDRVSAIILEALSRVTDAGDAERVLEQALHEARLAQPPRHPTALRYFLDRTLRPFIDAMEVPRFMLGAPSYELWIDHVVHELVTRHPRRDYESGTRIRRPSLGRHRLLLATVDPKLAAWVAEQVGPDVELVRVQAVNDLTSLLDVAPADVSGALLIDAVLSSVALPLLAAMAPALPPYCPVVVVGVPEEGWERLRALHPDVDLWRRCERLEDLDPILLLPTLD